jgi:hypothetical protein
MYSTGTGTSRQYEVKSKTNCTSHLAPAKMIFLNSSVKVNFMAQGHVKEETLLMV